MCSYFPVSVSDLVISGEIVVIGVSVGRVTDSRVVDTKTSATAGLCFVVEIVGVEPQTALL